MNLGNALRVVAVTAACLAAAASATSNQNQQQQGGASPQAGGYGSNNSPPPPQQMEPGRALGLWRSTFGAVKIEADNSKGGIQTGAVQGVWLYQRNGQDVIGYFSGSLRGNVLQFRWQEPNNPPLTGEGYLVFDPTGRQYSGRWWSDHRDRVGDWNGWRQSAQQGQGYAQGYGQYGGQQYGGYPQPQRYPQQQYPQQQYPQQQYPQQQYPQQQYPQQQYPQQQYPQQQYPQQQQPYPQQPPQQQQPQQPPPSRPYY